VCEGSTCSMASLTRWDLMRPLRSRFSMRALLVAPELRQAMVVVGCGVWGVECRV
jgi:hypothetical protein